MFIKSVDKTMRILSALSDNQNKPVSLNDICKKTSINKSTASHILSTLLDLGYVYRISQSAGYILGPKLYHLARYDKYEDELCNLCRPVMRWLHKKTSHSIVLSVMRADIKFVIEYLDSGNTLPYQKEHIAIDDIYRTATGRILLANMHHDDIERVLNKYGLPSTQDWPEITSRDILLNELQTIKTNNYVKTTCKNGNPVVLGYAKALYHDSSCVASLGIAVTCEADRYDSILKTEPEIKKHLGIATREINNRLKYS